MAGPDLKSLDPPVLLPNGREFKTWQPSLKFSKTYYVDGSAAAASDDNPGTKARPFRTINRAAGILQPGERAIVAAGVYREWVRPKRGGTSPAKMISYQAAPGAKVVIRGSRIVKDKWEASAGAKGLWKVPLAAKYFNNYNPFTIPNVTDKQFDGMSWARGLRGKKPYTLPRGLVFQDDRRLQQVYTIEALAGKPGTYWVSPKGRMLHINPFGGKNPNKQTMEITTQRCIFAPEKIGLGYIHVKGFIIEHSGNGFPMPQYGALSTWRGHHWLIEDNTVRQVNGVGIDIGTQYWGLPQPKVKPGWHIVRQNTITDCGVCGIQGMASRDNLIEDNLLVGNAFYPVERYWETGGIKTHGNVNTLIRRNRILDTHHGPGIWMDFANVNSRCSQNVVVGSRTVNGGIFIEASLRPNMIDHNFVWDTRGAGIYEHDCRGQIICHNLIGRSTGPAVFLRGKITNRRVSGEPIVGGDHTVVNNVLVANKEAIRTKDKQRDLANNLTDGVVADFDRKALTLTWHVTGARPKCSPVKGVTHDFFGKVRPPGPPLPGPFPALPVKSTAVKLAK